MTQSTVQRAEIAPDSFSELMEKVQAQHPEYADQLALARKAAELQKMTDEITRRQVRTPVVTYSGIT